MTPEEAVSLARSVIDKYGAAADKPSVRLAKALLDGAHERDRLRAELDRLDGVARGLAASHAQLRAEVAGAQGEILGLGTSLGFFQERCDVLEKAVVAKLSIRDADTLKGCCPLCGIHWKDLIQHMIVFDLETRSFHAMQKSIESYSRQEQEGVEQGWKLAVARLREMAK